MCVPTRTKRTKLKTVTAMESPTTTSRTVVKPCETVRERVPDPDPMLTSLVARRAIDLGDGVYADVKKAGRFIELEATTVPNNAGVWAQLVWEGDGLRPGSAANKKLFPRDTVTDEPVEVTVSLPTDEESESVRLAIVDLVSVASDLPKALSATKWKAYEKASQTTILTVVTNPDTEEVWRHLQWSEGAEGAQKNQRIIDIPTARDAHVTVTLGSDGEVFSDLHICKWPKLEVAQVAFTSITIDRDARGDFPKTWTKGTTSQPPLCFERNTAIDLEVTFDVTEAPTDDEDVRVEGTVTLGTAALRWEATVGVPATGGSVTTAPLTSDGSLPDRVDCYETSDFTWRFRDAEDTAWEDAGQTRQVIYALLGTPTKTVYWTFVDLSCRAARGTSTVDTFVEQVFAGFSNTTGDGRGIVRLRDNRRLTYYLQGRNTKSGDVEPRVWTTKGILDKWDGTGRCGGWSDVLLHTHAIHGVTVATEVEIYPATPKVTAGTVLFIVRNCNFTDAGVHTNPAPFPYEAPTTCTKVDGLAGQGKTNPHFIFGDHVLVRYNGMFYDPSYGVRMAEDHRAYENAAIAGLGLGTAGHVFTQGSTSQIITQYCSPGWVRVKYDGTQSLNQIAAHYGIASGQVLYDDPHNAGLKAKRGTKPLKVGDSVYVPRTLATRNFDLLKWVNK